MRRAVLLALALAGCTVGPDYQGPPEAAPISSRLPFFRRADPVATTAAPAASAWWQGLGDPTLDQLIQGALANSPSVAAAQARVARARGSVRESQAGLLPRVSASGLYTRARLPTGGLGSLTGGQGGGSSSLNLDLYSAGLIASWEPDLFGGTRRGIEGARASAQAAEAALADAQVQLAAEVAQAYVNLRANQGRVELSHRASDIQQRLLGLTRQRQAGGTAPQVEVERLSTQLNQTLADDALLQAETDQYLDQLAVLSGLEPGQLDAQLAASAPVPLPPAQVAVGDPATLLRHRPDIRQAERQLASSNAQIGQSMADYFPKVQLFGTLGVGATQASRLFSGNNLAAIGGPMISWDILGFARTSARVEEARAGRDEAVQQYRQAVLRALQDAETSLSRFRHQRDNLARLLAAQASADRAAALTRERNQAGTAALTDVLDTERQRVQTAQAVVQARAGLTSSFITVQKALGLGWEGGAPPTARSAE